MRLLAKPRGCMAASSKRDLFGFLLTLRVPFRDSRYETVPLAFLAAALLVAAPFSAARQESAKKEAAGQPSQKSRPIRVSVREVVVDVVVTDANGQPIQGLRPRDFELQENGEPQEIRSFVVHEAPPPNAPKLPSLPKLPANTFTNYSAVPEDAPLDVILLDLGNTPWDRFPYVRLQIRKFLEQQPLEARFAVFVMGAGDLRMIQGFTSDRNLLLAAINSKATYSLGFQTMPNPFMRGRAGPISVFGVSSSVASGSAADNPAPSVGGSSSVALGVGPKAPLVTIRRLQPSPRLKAAGEDFANEEQVDDTTGAFKRLAAILAGLPGRKNVFWFSAGFPLDYENLPAASVEAGTRVTPLTVDNGPAAENIVQSLETSRAAVYAIDARGLQVSEQIAEAYSEHMAMDRLAMETGGRAFYETNGLAQAMATAASEGENYYTLAYLPSDRNFNGGLRHILVRLRNGQLHYHLYYRKSYFANSHDATAWQPSDPLLFTLQHGAPPADQVLFWASLFPEGAPSVPAAQGKAASLKIAPIARSNSRQGPTEEKLHTYIVRFVIVPHGLSIAKAPNGDRQVELQFASCAYDSVGRRLRRVIATTRMTIKPDEYEQVRSRGLRVDQRLAVPVQTAWLRLAVRDAASGRVGSLEVPLAPRAARASGR